MVHLTVAIGRFFEILLFDIVKSIAGLVALAVIVLAGGLVCLAGLRKLCRKFTR